MGARVVKASLWLMPDGEVAECLAGWIQSLARRFRTEPFRPHVTLLSGLSGEETDLVAGAGRASASLAPIRVQLDALDGRDTHFRCLFARVVETAPLAAAHAKAAEAFGLSPEPDFLPHLSLVYGTLPGGTKRDVEHEAGPCLDLRFEARSLHLWSTAGPVAAWRELAVFPLGRA